MSSRSYFRLRHPGKSEFVEIDTDMFQDAAIVAPSPAAPSPAYSLWSAEHPPHCIVPREEIQQQVATLRRVVSMKESQWSNRNARRAAREDTKENWVMNRAAGDVVKASAPPKVSRAALNPCHHHNNPFLPSAAAAAAGKCVQGRHSSFNPTEEERLTVMRVPEFIRNGSVVVSRTYPMHEGEAASLECATCGRGLGVVMNGVPLGDGCIKLCQVCNAPPPAATAVPVTKMPKRGNAFVRSFRRILHF